MTTTLSFKLPSTDEKDIINAALGKIAERYPDCNKKGDALLKIVDLYNSGFTESVFREIPPSVSETINEVECSYLKYEGESLGFFCYERFHTKKKGEPIGASHDKVISRCNLCRLGKFDKDQSRIQDMLRKKNIKGLLELRDILIKLTHESTLAQIYICKAKLLDEHELIISADGIHLKCLFNDDEAMSVIEHCYVQVNPYDMNPPCKYLIDPHVRVRPPDRAEEILEELKQMEHRPQEETTDESKIIDAEVIDDSEIAIPQVDTLYNPLEKESEEDKEKKENEE